MVDHYNSKNENRCRNKILEVFFNPYKHSLLGDDRNHLWFLSLYWKY